ARVLEAVAGAHRGAHRQAQVHGQAEGVEARAEVGARRRHGDEESEGRVGHGLSSARTAATASATSEATRPTPLACAARSPAMPCNITAAHALSKASPPGAANRAPTTPASTSPVPPLAMPG